MIFGVPDRLLRRLPDISEWDSAFVLGCAKSTLACGRVFHGAKLKFATPHWQRGGRRCTPIRPRQEGSHFSNLNRGFARETAFLLGEATKPPIAVVAHAGFIRVVLTKWCKGCRSRKLGVGPRTTDLSWRSTKSTIESSLALDCETRVTQETQL